MGCDYLGECIPGKNILQTAKKIVLQEGSQPRRVRRDEVREVIGSQSMRGLRAISRTLVLILSDLGAGRDWKIKII